MNNQNEETQAAEGEEYKVPTVFTNAPDGTMIERPATPEELEHAAKGELREAKRVEESNEVLALLDPVDVVHVEEHEVTVGTNVLKFNFKLLSFRETASLEAKKY